MLPTWRTPAPFMAAAAPPPSAMSGRGHSGMPPNMAVGCFRGSVCETPVPPRSPSVTPHHPGSALAPTQPHATLPAQAQHHYRSHGSACVAVGPPVPRGSGGGRSIGLLSQSGSLSSIQPQGHQQQPPPCPSPPTQIRPSRVASSRGQPTTLPEEPLAQQPYSIMMGRKKPEMMAHVMTPTFAAATVPSADSLNQRPVASPQRADEFGTWSLQRCYWLCPEGEESCFQGQATMIIDRHVVDTLHDAVEKLNRRLIDCPEDCCIVYSATERAYYLLTRVGCEDAVLSRFGISSREPLEAAPGNSFHATDTMAAGRLSLGSSGAADSDPCRPQDDVTPVSVNQGCAACPAIVIRTVANAPERLSFCEDAPTKVPAGAVTPSVQGRYASPAPQKHIVMQFPRSRVQPLAWALEQVPAENTIGPLQLQQPKVHQRDQHHSPVKARQQQEQSLQPQQDFRTFQQQLQSHQVTPRATLQKGVLTEPEKIKYSDLEMVESLGSGEFGQVFRGVYQGEEVAIKRLYWDDTMSALVMQDLAREIKSFRHLRHKRLVRFIGACWEMPNPCLVTEYMPGGSLHHLLHVRKVSLPTHHAINMCLQILDGVMYLHSQKPTIVHRDLKSLNVVLDLGLNIKICDFGLTEPMERTHITKRNNGGSPRYMAPELFDAKTKITEKIDVWAMGCIFVEIFGGPLPYATIANLADLTRELLVHRRPPDVPEFIIEEVRIAFVSCLDFDPRVRPSSESIFEQLRVAKKTLKASGRL